MKKRIVKKKENREINDLIHEKRQNNDVLVWDSVEGINFSTIYSNNKRSTHGFPKRNHKKIYKNIIKVSIESAKLFKLYNNARERFPWFKYLVPLDSIETEEIKKEMNTNDYCISRR